MGSRSQVIDPPRTTQEGGGGGGWAWLVTARGIIEAQLIRGVLEEAGVVQVWLDTRDPSPSAWMFMSGDPNAPVPVYVAVSELDTARLALLESGLGGSTGDESAEGEVDGDGSARSARWSPSGRLGVWIAVLVVVILLLASARASVTS